MTTIEIDVELLEKILKAFHPFAVAYYQVQSVDEFEKAIEKSTNLKTFSIAIKKHLMDAKVSPKDWENLTDACVSLDDYLRAKHKAQKDVNNG